MQTLRAAETPPGSKTNADKLLALTKQRAAPDHLISPDHSKKLGLDICKSALSNETVAQAAAQ